MQQQQPIDDEFATSEEDSDADSQYNAAQDIDLNEKMQPKNLVDANP